jgi:hypothetical protein
MDTIAVRNSLGLRQAPNISVSEPVAQAIAAVKERIARQCRVECEALRSDLMLIVDNFAERHGIKAIGWSSPNDKVEPSVAIGLLTTRLAEQLAEQEFERFLARFN